MSYEKETSAGLIEQKIQSIMEAVGNEIMDYAQKGTGTKEGEIVQNIRIASLNKCAIYLSNSIEGIND